MAKKPTRSKTAAQREADQATAKRKFLNILRVSCNVAGACRTAKIGRRTAYDWREADAEFAQAWADAEQEAADALEQEAWKRATVGQSDRLMEILLKGHRPERYVDKLKGEFTGAITVKIEGPAADL
jgi:hypothetical protein